VYENKGPLWKTGGQSGNVYEHKGSYRSKAGMLLKTHGLSFRPASKRQGSASRLGLEWRKHERAYCHVVYQTLHRLGLPGA
jgi:carbohydrate-selective porin OprB